MQEIAQRLEGVKRQIAHWERQYQRPAGSVTLLAVSKSQGIDALRQAVAAGQRRFGESYVQEALNKIQALRQYDIEWHFIGPVQSNKTRMIAENFDWVHSVDRLKIAQRLDAQRATRQKPLNICIQVNISGEGSKSGVMSEQVPLLLAQLGSLKNLRVRGMMAIPAPATDIAVQRREFARLAGEFREMRERFPRLPLDTLSMGMSSDLEAAIAEGATVVRVGSAIFGARK